MSGISNTIPASEARSSFYTILKEVGSKLKRFTITRRGKAQAIVMHPEEVASWEETMEVLGDSRLVRDIVKAERELAAGKLIGEKKLMRKLEIREKDLD